jgi:hypothetical protein
VKRRNIMLKSFVALGPVPNSDTLKKSKVA